MENTETKAADAILQNPAEIEVGDRTYEIAPPTVATLIQVSKHISQIPKVNTKTNDVLGETLAKAENMGAVGRLFAVMILGCKKPVKRSQRERNRFFDFLLKRPKKDDPETELANYIQYNITPKQLNKTLTLLFQKMQIADFFALIASLTEVNLLKATKEAMETTASGQPSPESQSPTT